MTSIAGNANYTKVDNTLSSAAELLGSLSGLELSGLLNSVVPLDTRVAVTTADVALTDTQLLQARNGLYIDASGLTADRALTVGADTAANAARLQRLFGLVNANDSVTISFPYYLTAAAFQLSLANTSATSASVDIQLNGAGDADTQVLANASASATRSLHQVQVIATSVTLDAETIAFNVLNQNAPLAVSIAPTTADIALTDAQLLQALKGLPVDASGLTGTRALTVGADTAANAAHLQHLFGLASAGDCVTISFPYLVTAAAQALDFENTSGTHTNVDILLNGAAAADTQQLAAASSVPRYSQHRMIVRADTVTAGSEVISFNILGAGAATAVAP